MERTILWLGVMVGGCIPDADEEPVALRHASELDAQVVSTSPWGDTEDDVDPEDTGLEEPPGDGTLWSHCTANDQCESGECVPFTWKLVDGQSRIEHGLCSWSQDWSEEPDPQCEDLGGAWYMPGCVALYCLPACEVDEDCPDGLTCGGWGDWNPTVCGYW